MINKEDQLYKKIFILFLAIAMGYSTFVAVFPRDSGQKAAAIARLKAQILCEHSLAKTAVIENFMLQAADARRAGAAVETNPIAAKNDLAAAKKYEYDAKELARLTIENC